MRSLGDQKGATGIGLKHCVPLFNRDIFERCCLERPRIVDQQVKPPKTLNDLIDSAYNAIFFAYLAWNCKRLNAKRVEICNRLLGLIRRTAIGNCSIRPSGGQSQSKSPTNLLRATRYKCTSACKRRSYTAH